MRRLLLAIPAALLLAAPPADAAKVEVFSRCTKYDCLHVATFSAAPGEARLLDAAVTAARPIASSAC